MSRAEDTLDEPQSVADKHRQDDRAPDDTGAEPAPEKSKDQEAAAAMIQRNYRGYRERRQLAGMGLDADTRWSEAIKEARWRSSTRPMSRAERARYAATLTPPDRNRDRAGSSAARQNWKRVGEIARRAGSEDPEEDTANENELGPEELEQHRKKKAEQKAEREKMAKMMDLQYFLEMVDQKHRYGSNLRAYHEQWKKSNTHENFFYWLDQGEGTSIELPTVSRERLEKEQVRYLSREERMSYLVKIDKDGRLCWAKNGERIMTSPEFKDSVDGIVKRDDTAPAYSSHGKLDRSKWSRRSTISSLSSKSSSEAEHSDVEGQHYVNHDLDEAKGISKIKYVSAATILNHLLRGSVKPNSWIFVADTSFRLYIGIKQSGAFQHSSFLHGARILSAGLIKIKNGQLRRLSPLSGHYRPPTKNFRAFVHSLQDNGVDMSRVSISRSYAVLVGLEAYVKTRKKFKHGVEHVQNAETKVLHPEDAKRKEEEAKDKSKSAQRERQILAANAEKQEATRKEKSWHRRLWKRLSVSPGNNELKKVEEKRKAKILSTSGEDVESGIPPDGQRDAPA